MLDNCRYFVISKNMLSKILIVKHFYTSPSLNQETKEESKSDVKTLLKRE